MSSLDVSIREKPSSPQAISNFGNFGENANPIEGEQLYIMSSKVLMMHSENAHITLI